MIEFLLGAIAASFVLFIVNRVRQDRRTELPPRRGPQEIYELVTDDLIGYYEKTADPADLREHTNFQRLVEILTERHAELANWIMGGNPVLACAAAEALGQARTAEEESARELLACVNVQAAWPRYFVLNSLALRVDPKESLVGPLLLELDGSWSERFSFQFLKALIQKRVSGGEQLTFGGLPDALPEDQAEWLRGLLQRLGEKLVRPLAEELDRNEPPELDPGPPGPNGRLAHQDLRESIGRVWGQAESSGVIEHDSLKENSALAAAALQRKPPRSVLLIGERGVGKTTVVRHLAGRLREEGWRVFEAGHVELLAGQMYIGQLEGRMKELLEWLESEERIIWYIPDFHLLSWTGRHLASPVAVLTYILPLVERGSLRIIGETTPSAYERLIQSDSRCRSLFENIRVKPLNPDDTLDLARRCLPFGRSDEAPPLASEETLREARELASQYLGDESSPGNLLDILKRTREEASRTAGRPGEHISLDDVIASLSGITGLPLGLLDERRDLDLKKMKQFFEQRVMGQPEAVDCLLERVAMIKAGLTDPSRPCGVFLFAGPTGTGKTEIVKTLAEALFGSSNRMIRLDMSEYQTSESIGGIIGEYAPPALQIQASAAETGGALVDKIRRQPFSVVLLDEFEKAHPRIWDLFLQVFDDGRLTDARGARADFRHTLFVLTSNAGSALSTNLRLGFTDEPAVVSPGEVRQAIYRTFSKEFLNRLDRIVIFRPLSRDTIREILHKEIEESFRRRGLRNRSWTLVWDESSLEFLIEKGFTQDMGARPLKRAVERYLLTPLAQGIVGRDIPTGDQFLVLHAGQDRLEVEFVNPEVAAEEPPSEEEPALAPDREGDAAGITSILLSARGDAREMHLLEERLTRLSENLNTEDWKRNKQTAFELMAQADFWSSSDRFSILGEVEYLDRMEAGLETAWRLLNQLKRSDSKGRHRFPRQLTHRLAQQLFLLDAAWETVQKKQPRDAFLRVEAAPGSTRQETQANNDFAQRLASMYKEWARKRGMKVRLLREQPSRTDKGYEFLAAVSGFGAYLLLAPEQGLQVMETPGVGHDMQRATVRVWVWPQPEVPPDGQGEDLASQAESTFRDVANVPLSVVRRYQEDPSPLVRDNFRKWRTGHLDRVLAGDFDLFGAASV